MHINHIISENTLKNQIGMNLEERAADFTRAFPEKKISHESLRRIYVKNKIRKKKVRVIKIPNKNETKRIKKTI